MQPPVVSVVMIAFNVERYVEAALQSALAQSTDFPFEIVVGEDCSTDRTREIVVEYAAMHPGRIRPFFRPVNLGMNANFFATFEACVGKYVALLDADDYWLHRDKLQRQVNLMEAHPEVSLCFHNALVVYEDDTEANHPFHLETPDRRLSAPVPAARTGLRDIVRGNYIQTSSVIYRGGLVPNIPAWARSMPTFDWPLHLLHAEKGEIDYIDEIMSAYRVHRGGFWSTNLSHYPTLTSIESMIEAFDHIDRHLKGAFRDEMGPSLAYLYDRALQRAMEHADGRAAARYADQLLALETYRSRRRSAALQVIAKAGGVPFVGRALSKLSRALRMRAFDTGR